MGAGCYYGRVFRWLSCCDSSNPTDKIQFLQFIEMKLTLLVQPDTAPNGEAGFSSLCPELDIASQGATEEEARQNLREALDLFFEDASREEIERRLANGARVTQLEMVL